MRTRVYFERRSGGLVVLSGMMLLRLQAAGAQLPPDQVKFFETSIRPLLAAECFSCHSSNSRITFGGLRMDTRARFFQGGQSGALVVAGKPEESLLVKAVSYAASLKMPPTGKLKPAQLQAITEWVRMGAPWPEEADETQAPASTAKPVDTERRKHWAWQPVTRFEPPNPQNRTWSAGAIDRFILARLEQTGLRPSADAERQTLLRRVYFDLAGLPPKPADIEAFLTDRSPQAFERVVDRLLGSVQYGERWARHWLDLTYFADNLEIGRKIPAKEAWRYRDYVISAFNTDKPYSKFITEQLAGDLLPAESDDARREQVVATGFLALGPWSLADADKEQTVMDIVDLQVDLIGKSLLGLTLGCARCHDHKFDPIPAKDYYAMAGILRSTQTLDTHRDSGHFSDVSRVLLPESPEELRERAARTEKALKDLAEAQREHKNLTGEREELRKDEQPTGEIDKKVAEVAKRIAWMQYLRPEPPYARAVRDVDAPADARVNIRGNPHTLGDPVPRSFVQIAMWDPTPPRLAFRASGRRELAEWVASEKNPLTARVMVNRIWQHLFGAGLVRSVDNFGLRGERPSHPELLDYLASRFVEQGWSVKQMVREMILSHTYRQSSNQNAKAYQEDPQNRLLWRMSPRRLEAETLRDALLAVTQTLSETRGGPTLPLENPQNLNLGVPPEFRDDAVFPPELLKRRTVYLPVLRKSQHSSVDILNLFDFPDVNTVNGARNVTTVPTQALYLINSAFVQEQARLLADRAAETVTGDNARVQWLVLRVLGREARTNDVEDAIAFLKAFTDDAVQQGGRETAAPHKAWARYCQALLVSNEFLYLM